MNGLIALEQVSLRPIAEEILALNEVSSKYGLTLSEQDAKELSDMRNKAISENERVEIGVGIVADIVKRFCTSRYITEENYTYVLNEVTYLFYYIKTETDDKISDADLLKELFDRFELQCRGSVDVLETREAERIIRKVNSGENYEKWYKYRDELGKNSEITSREAPYNVVEGEYGNSFFDKEEVSAQTSHEVEVSLSEEDEHAIELDAFDEFFEQEAREKAMDDNAHVPAIEEDPDEDEEDEEDV